MEGWLKLENEQGNPNVAFWGFLGQGKDPVGRGGGTR